MTTLNPLIAERRDTTGRMSGIPIAEDIEGVLGAFGRGDWIDSRIGGLAPSMDALAFVVDPSRPVSAWGVAWLIEHVQSLSDALDALAGDPDQIAAFAQTWHNVGRAVEATAADLLAAIGRETGAWIGTAADAYRQHAGEHLAALAALGSAAHGIGDIVHGAGRLVAAVRTLVRDLVAAFVAELSTRLFQWLAEEAVSLVLATPGLISRVAGLVAAWAERIADLLDGLVTSLRRLSPIVDRLSELITSSNALLERLDRTGAGLQDPTSVTAMRTWSAERLDAWARERAESLLALEGDKHARMKERLQWWVQDGVSMAQLRAIESQLWNLSRSSLEEGLARSFGHALDSIEERSGPDTSKEQFDRWRAEQWASPMTTDQLARELRTLADKAEFGQAQPDELALLQYGADILSQRQFTANLEWLGGLSDAALARTIEELDIRAQQTGSPDDARTLALAKDVELGRRSDKGLDTVVINEAGRVGTIRDLAAEAYRSYVHSSLNALTGNIASASTFAATGNPSLAEAVGQTFDAFGGLAEGRNQWQAAHAGASGVGADDITRAAEVTRDQGDIRADDRPRGPGPHEPRGGASPGPDPDAGRRYTRDEVDHIVRGIVEADTPQPGHAPPGGHGPRAVAGEQGMGFHYSHEKGWAFLDGPSGSGGGHPWNAGGPDGFAYRTEGAFELHILDNKSYQDPGNVRAASALTETLAATVHERLTQAMDPRMNDVPRIDEVRRALADTEAALRSGTPLPSDVHLVVTNEGGRASGVSATLADQGVEFRDIQTPAPGGTDAR
jgi:hypothetical protein